MEIAYKDDPDLADGGVLVTDNTAIGTIATNGALTAAIAGTTLTLTWATLAPQIVTGALYTITRTVGNPITFSSDEITRAATTWTITTAATGAVADPVLVGDHGSAGTRLYFDLGNYGAATAEPPETQT